ncbi:hypothetical protein FPOAC2_04329 [Fusarium poae]
MAVNALDGKGKKSSKQIVQATINVYGPKHFMDEVDQALSTIPSSLQHPLFLEPNIPYINPQFFYPGHEKTDLRHLVGQNSEDGTSGLSHAVDEIMGSLNNWSNDQESSISRFHLILDQYLVDTKLKDHQLQGVNFILSREDPEVAKQMERQMLISIDHSLLMRSDTSCSGGIVADMMGLGKTLTMLSAILCSKQIKQRYRIGGYDDHHDFEERPQLTLVVLPSRQLLDVWKNEIDRRFRPQTFKTQIFHGQTRAKDRDYLLSNDIILTTYHTLERDSSSNRILSTIIWSRIVLDEGKSKISIPENHHYLQLLKRIIYVTLPPKYIKPWYLSRARRDGV